MVKKRVLSPQSVWDKKQLTAAFEEAGIKVSHIPKLYKHLVRHPDVQWQDIPDLPKAAVQLLEQRFSRCTCSVEACQTSGDGETTKMLVRLQDGLQVEAVIMQYDTTCATGVVDDRQPPGEEECASESGASASTRGRKRATLCVSSQVGCQMGCTFCATGTMGLTGHLTAGEILEQLVHARRVTAIRNVVFMGMGEPLNNYDNVCAAVGLMTDSRYFSLRRSAVTVSTVGVIPRILQLVEDLPGVSLALSLHAPNQALRQSIVPSASAYKIEKLMAAVATYQERSKQKVFIEYVMLAHVNDNPEQAHELGALLQGRDVVLNLIPWNPIYSPDIDFKAPGPERLIKFHGIVRSEYGVACTIRQEKGQDIGGACGQLVVEHGGQGCSSNAAVKDIEELGRRTALVAV
ncbi:hypothetical protein WJX72_009538 [[Myrmecia] bisecta]|uniref:Radical SAM core domain-containing protein n=1 Tax=[Myrmecia] bisecta TaxID=41462 RepID=A0AAW1P6D6_9CHLO